MTTLAPPPTDDGDTAEVSAVRAEWYGKHIRVPESFALGAPVAYLYPSGPVTSAHLRELAEWALVAADAMDAETERLRVMIEGGGDHA